jgi:hypothetical protein
MLVDLRYRSASAGVQNQTVVEFELIHINIRFVYRFMIISVYNENMAVVGAKCA